MSNSSHISWKSIEPESVLRTSLGAVGHSIVEIPSQDWDPKTSTIGGVRDYKLCAIAPRSDDWSFFLLHLNSEIGRCDFMARLGITYPSLNPPAARRVLINEPGVNCSLLE